MSNPKCANPAQAEAGTGQLKSGDEADALNSAVSLTKEQVTDCLLLVNRVRAEMSTVVLCERLSEHELRWIEMAINWTAPDLPYAVRMAAYRLFEKGVV